MRMRIILLSVLTAAGIAVAAAPQAVAGGCGHDPTHGTGSTVLLEDACVRPSITAVEPGTTITFVNRDSFAHNVSGQQWGHWEDLPGGSSFRATFRNEGIYPFACTLHPGMTGAIVVGDGTGPGNGEAVVVAAAEPSAPADPPAPPAAVTSEGAAATIPPIVALIVGAVAGLAVGAFGRRRRSTGVTPQRAHP